MERKSCGVGRKDLRLAVLQVVTTGEDDPLPFGQLMAVATHGVGAADGSRQPVENVEPFDGLAIRLHPQQDDLVEFGVADTDLGHRLFKFLQRLGEHGAPAGHRVVHPKLELAVARCR